MIALHPFGDPQTVVTGSDGEVVTVVWRVGAPDDLTLLGIDLGVLPEDRVMLDGAITYDAGDADLVADSPELVAYVLEHVAVHSEGEECTGAVSEVGDLIADGATLAFTCPGPVSQAEIAVTTLTDLHPAYRTLATGPDGQRAVYDQSASTHAWTFDPAVATAAVTGGTATAPASSPAGTDLGSSAAPQMGGVGAVLVLLAAGGLALRRRAQRTTTSTPS